MKSLFAGIAAAALAEVLMGAGGGPMHRYVVESTSPPVSEGKAKTNDESLGVRWLRRTPALTSRKPILCTKLPAWKRFARLLHSTSST